MDKANPPPIPVVITKRFPFGEEIKEDGISYRYLYTQGDSDVLIRDNEKPMIFLVLSKYIVAD